MKISTRMFEASVGKSAVICPGRWVFAFRIGRTHIVRDPELGWRIHKI